jgi:hypothetical protein
MGAVRGMRLRGVERGIRPYFPTAESPIAPRFILIRREAIVDRCDVYTNVN